MAFRVVVALVALCWAGGVVARSPAALGQVAPSHAATNAKAPATGASNAPSTPVAGSAGAVAAAGQMAGQTAGQTDGSSANRPGAAVDAAAQAKAAAAASGAKASGDSRALQQISKLPPINGTGIDVEKRNAEVLLHLNGILRFYRAALMPVQKVGEPSDVLYAEQSSAQALAIAQVAFEAAKNEAALLGKVQGSAPTPKANGVGSSAGVPAGVGGEAQRWSATRTAAQAKLADLQTQQTQLQAGIAAAKRGALPALQQQEEQIEGGIELQKAMVEALDQVASFSDAQTQTGLAGDIDRLQRSAPELLTNGAKPPTPPLLSSLAAVHEAGVTTQAETLFELLSSLRSIDSQTTAIDALRKEADGLRTPFVKVLGTTVKQGQALTQQAVNAQATPNTDAQTLANTRAQFDTLTSTFQVLANATMPLSQEIVLLENARGTLTTWRTAVSEEETGILRDLLVRVVVIAVLLGLLGLASSLWSKATVRYVNDLRRRRQLLFVRRAVIGFLSGLVVLFGFVTQFSSLATFAGFISAGIAVGLQSILLSVAAYFFIVGRYGVRVGDRITVAGVTGDVIEVGLVRFYLMELVGTGTALHSTGRVAVFANSILFQTGTPLYKQMPGTEYAWHELTAKLTATADVPAVTKDLLGLVGEVYGGYRRRIETQHRDVEGWVGTALPVPEVESRLQLIDGGLQFAVLFPVEIPNAASTDQSIAEELMKRMAEDGALKAGMTDLPVIKAAVKS